MKKAGLSIMIVILMMSFGSFNANASEPIHTVWSYLKALKQGDIEAIKDSIAGEFYSKRKVLLEQNEHFSEFLKKYYQDARFRIGKTTVKDGNVLISVDVDMSGRKSKFTLLLSKDTAGNWKIFKEIDLAS